MNRAGGFGAGIASIAVGAVLAWAVTAEVGGVDLHPVGVVLFVVGIIGLLLSVAVAATPRRRRSTTVAGGTPTVARERAER